MLKNSPLACLILLFSSFPLAWPEDVIEEIVVRGELRPVKVSELASSVYLANPDDSVATTKHLEEIVNRAANVNFSSGSSRARYFQIRGIGERGQFIEPINPSVGLILDGVDLSGVGTVANLFDIEQVEILRGPQGTVFGSNSLAGTINIVSSDPTEEFSGFVEAEAGDYGARGLGFVLSGPVTPESGLRLSAKHFENDGFMENTHLGVKDTNSKDEKSVRLKYLLNRGDSIYRFNLGRLEVNNGYDAFSLDNDRFTRSDEPGVDDQDTTFVSLSMNRKLSDSIGLEMSGGLAGSEISYGYDDDWTFEGFHPFEYKGADLYQRDADTFTYQIRLRSEEVFLETVNSFDWVVGAYGYNHELDLVQSYNSEQIYESAYGLDRYAVFGEVIKKLSQEWRIRAGLRGEQVAIDYSDSDEVGFDPDDFLMGGRILLERSLDSGRLVYFGARRGVKARGFNADGDLDEEDRLYDEETLWNFEAGYKGKFLDDRLAIQTALFRMKRQDIQISTSIEKLKPGGGSKFIEYTGNAAEGYNQGLEIDLEFLVIEGLNLGLSLGLLDTEFSSYRNPDPEVATLSGREQAHAPSYQFFMGADYSLNANWSFHVEIEGKDSFHFSDGHDFKSEKYELINVGIQFQRDRWEAKAWLKNATDEKYFVRGYYFMNDPRDEWEFPRLYTQLGYPRHFGVSVRASF